MSAPSGFTGILFDRTEAVRDGRDPRDPPFFADLNLDQVFAAIAAGREEYDLAPFFRVPLRDGQALFLRAERTPDGQRTFRLPEGKPLATSYGEDLYRQIFAGRAGGPEVRKLPGPGPRPGRSRR